MTLFINAGQPRRNLRGHQRGSGGKRECPVLRGAEHPPDQHRQGQQRKACGDCGTHGQDQALQGTRCEA